MQKSTTKNYVFNTVCMQVAYDANVICTCMCCICTPAITCNLTHKYTVVPKAIDNF